MLARRHAVADDEPVESSPLQEIIDWRVTALGAAGYGYDASVAVGNRLDIDLHVACDLLRGGCDVPTALKILL